MRVRLSFDQDPDGRFVLLAEERDASSTLKEGPVTVKSFDHEDLFLKVLMDADLEFSAIAAIAGAVLKTISDPAIPVRPVEVDLTREQYATLGLADGDSIEIRGATGNGKVEPFEFVESAAQFHDFLMQAPTPFVMLSGPEHRFTFINPPYVRLIGRTSDEEILGKPVRKVLPELEGQKFFELLDQVYATGIPYVGIEIHAYMRNRHVTGMEDRYFDFIYHPVRTGGAGPVSGILVLATDVTDSVLARQMTEEREAKLYHQWAELEAIYRTAPMGLAVVETREFRVFRVNEMQAKWMSSTVDEMVGRRIAELPDFRVRREMFEQVAAGESIRNEVMNVAGKRWLINMSPLLGVTGEVEAVNSITTAWMGAETEG